MKRISVSLEDDMAKRVEDAAWRDRISQAEVIRRALEAWLAMEIEAEWLDVIDV